MKCLGNEKEEYISNLNLEDESVLGSLVRYDILFVADIPKSDKQQMINIEIQMNDLVLCQDFGQLKYKNFQFLV